jgi:phosphoglycolate phosphatase
MTGPPLVLFDLDGTLTDPKVGITVSMQHALAAVGVLVEDPDELTWCIGPPIIDNFARFGVTGDRAIDALAAYRERYDRVGAYENILFDGIPELLAGLTDEGRRLGVATSKAEHSARAILEHFGLAGYFEFIGGASADSVRSVKADVIAYVLKHLGDPDPARGVMVGDRHHDIDGARLNRLASIAVRWGYAEPGELEAAHPDHIVSTIPELAAVLKDGPGAWRQAGPSEFSAAPERG